MLKQPIYVEFNLDAKTSPSKLIAISHVDDKYSEVLEVAVKQNDRFVYMGGATVFARMVLHRDKDYLLSDTVPCIVNDNGNILIPFDNAVVKTQKGIVKIEVNITRDADELTLQFPLWVSVNGSILDNAEVTPESKGTIPDLLKEAADALEDATEALEQLGSYRNLSDKPQINSHTLDGNQSSDDLGLQKKLTAGANILIDANGNISVTGVTKYKEELNYTQLDNCTENGVLYYTTIGGYDAFVVARNGFDHIRQFAIVGDKRLITRRKQKETSWQPAGEWSVFESIGVTDYEDLDNKPEIRFAGQRVTLNGVLDFFFGDFNGEVLPSGVRISLRENVFSSTLSPSSDILYNFNLLKSNLLYTSVFKIRKVDVTNLPQEFTDAGATIYVYHYVTTKTYSDLIRMVTYDTADGVKMWIQLVTLGGMDASDNVQVTAQTAWTDLTKDSGEMFIVGLTLTSQTGGVMDKTAAQIFEAFNQGKTVILTGTFGDQDISLKVITAAEGTLDETITLTAIAITEPDGTLFHIYVPRGETNAFALHTYNLNALDGTTFFPSVSSEGVISWTNDGGKQNPPPVNIKGPQGLPGDDYVLTAQDKTDIANIVLQLLPTTQGVLYGNASN